MSDHSMSSEEKTRVALRLQTQKRLSIFASK